VRSAILILTLIASAAHAQEGVVIERATVPWRDLERLLRNQTVVRPRASAPLSYALGGFSLGGKVSREEARLELDVEIQLLGEQWIEAPLLSASAAIASAEVIGLPADRAVITRRDDRVVFIGKGPGTAKVHLSFEMPLSKGSLQIAPLGLSGGRARLELDFPSEEASGRTRWRVVAGRPAVIEATLGHEGVDLVIGERGKGIVASSLEELEAVTSVTLGGGGVTRVRLRATPDEHGVLELTLPEGASPWRLFVGKRATAVGPLSDGRFLRIPLDGESTIELVYTFSGEGLGIRGRHRVELPRLAQPVRSAGWDLWLPAGLKYGATQASLGERASCGQFQGRVPIEAQGQCRGFAKPVLGPGAPYVEIEYDQL